MLYQEGWGVGSLKHSDTYSGGQSRSYARTYAPLRACGFSGFSPFTRPRVIAVAEGIPFDALTEGRVEKLYALKGEIVSRGVEAITGQQDARLPEAAVPARGGRTGGLRAALPLLRGAVPRCVPLAVPRRRVIDFLAADREAREGSILGLRPPRNTVGSLPPVRLLRRGGAARGRRHGSGRHDLPDEPGVPLALPHVRSLEEHARDADAEGRDPGADAIRAREAAFRERPEALQRGQFLRPRGDSEGGPRGDRLPRARFRARGRGMPSRARRRIEPEVSRSPRVARAFRSRWGSRRRTRRS